MADTDSFYQRRTRALYIFVIIIISNNKNIIIISGRRICHGREVIRRERWEKSQKYQIGLQASKIDNTEDTLPDKVSGTKMRETINK